MEILKCENVRKVYGSGNNQVVALDHIDFVRTKRRICSNRRGIRLGKIYTVAYFGKCG